jgi:hypothetical protein
MSGVTKRELRRIASAAERERQAVIGHIAATLRLSHEDASLLYDHSTSDTRRRLREQMIEAAS